MSLNLERQLRFYGAYHHNPVNIAIHMTCVPVILLTAFALATNTGTLVELPPYLTVPHLELNLGTIVCVTYCGLYILLEPVAGTGLSLLLLAGTAAGSLAIEKYGATANYYAVGAHIFSWIAQFIGHGKFEGRAPALLDNLFQAFFLAPLFVWLELLFACGYRPELQSRVNKLVEQDVKKFRAEKEQKRLCGGSTDGNGSVKVNGHAKHS